MIDRTPAAHPHAVNVSVFIQREVTVFLNKVHVWIPLLQLMHGTLKNQIIKQIINIVYAII